MFCYIKDRKTFHTLLQRTVTDWSVCVDSIEATGSTATLACDDVPGTMAGNWFVLNGRVFLIDKLQAQNGTTKVSLLPFWMAFDRDLVFAASAASMGAFIASWINAGWKNQSDTEYKMSYLSVTNTDSTAYQDPEMSENGVFNLATYIQTAKAKGVDLTAQMSGGNLAITISKHTPTAFVLIDKDGHTQVMSSAFSGQNVAKVTIVQPVDSGNVDGNGDPIYTVTATDWYLAADGSIGTTVPVHRADGGWVTIEIGEDDVQLEKAQERFAENDAAHKVEFFSDQPMTVNDTYKMRLNGTVFDGKISAVYLQSADSRTRFSSGELATTLTERVTRLGG